MKTKIFYGILLFICLAGRSFAQVEGLSYELGGAAEYTFFDDKVGIEDGILLGGEFGFGFGRFLELKGSYYEGMNLQRDFSGFDQNFAGLEDLDIDLRRYGGDMQVNLMGSSLKPYLTFGAGVQEIEGDNLEQSSSLYFRGGLGLLLTANDRFAWNLFGNITSFSNNPYADLLTDAERTTYNVDLASTDYENSVNYSVGTKLNFYLGGRDPDELTDLDRALERSFQSGFRGTTLEFEPTYTWLDFHEDLPFQNTQAVGAKLGVDFGPYFGLRGFYHRAMEDGEFLDFVDLSMYGGEAVFNLNEPNGIVPFITIGGGYLDVGDDYVGRDGVAATLEDKPYATGGLGLRVPLANVFLLKGSVKSMIMTNEDLEEVVSTQDITNSWAYEVGVEFKLGKKQEKPNVIEMSEYDKALYELRTQAEADKNSLLSESDREIQKLNEEIERLKQEKASKKETSEDSDREDKVEIKIEHENAPIRPDMPPHRALENQIIIPKMEDGEVYIRFGQADNTIRTQGAPLEGTVVPSPSPQPNTVSQPSGIVMQPDELKELIRSLTPPQAPYGAPMMDSTRAPHTGTITAATMSPQLQAEYNELKVQNKILEFQLQEMTKNLEQKDNEYEEKLKAQVAEMEDEYERRKLKDELKQTERERKEIQREMRDSERRGRRTSTTQHDDVYADPIAEPYDTSGRFLQYQYTSGMAIIGLGEANGVGIGFRTHYGIRGTQAMLVPQVYYGVVGQNQYGFDFNVQLPVMKTRYENFEPYVGLGVGLAGLEESNSVVDNTGTFNILVGTNYYTEHGHFYFDYTNRNFFNMNQLAAGYVFNF